ncbi:LysR family transcriptional regulator [Serratia marcescens]|nr:LysR family transcriptional regulator [Serratia marcescens]
MLDPLTLDQLRVFVAIAEHGSFSAAARKLYRAQSAVSGTIAGLESTLGVKLFDRSNWKPEMTPHGLALLSDAQALLARTDEFKARALGLIRGLEAELSVVLDVMYPTDCLVDLVISFQETFPKVALRLSIDVLDGVSEHILNGNYDLGVKAVANADPELVSHTLQDITLTPVVGPQHALAVQHAISMAELGEYTQILLTKHGRESRGSPIAVYSTKQILTSDAGSKRAMLIAGLGWGYMPRKFIEGDLLTGRLVEMNMADRALQSLRKTLFVIHRSSKPLGIAGQWMLKRLMENAEGSES